jgi:hypothetical protein
MCQKNNKKELNLQNFYLGLQNWVIEALCFRQNRPMPSSRCSVRHTAAAMFIKGQFKSSGSSLVSNMIFLQAI